MDEKTLTALRQSIEKWERNAVAEVPTDFTTGMSTCSLCDMFSLRACAGCPINDKTNDRGCIGSPYAGAVGAKYEWLEEPSREGLRAKAQAAARAEVEFLRSLLPEEEPTP